MIPSLADRIVVPEGSKPGDRFAASFDAGWYRFDQASRAAVDGDLISLHKALSELSARRRNPIRSPD